MTKTRIVGAGLAGLMVLFVLVPTAASAPRRTHFRHYQGETSQGGSVTAKTFLRDGTREGVIRFRSLTLDCEDDTQLQIEWEVGWDGLPTPGRLDFDGVYPFVAFHLHGRLGSHAGSGTVSFSLPMLNADEQAQLCTTGELTWQVERTDAASASLPSADVQVQITLRADGAARIVITPADGSTGAIITRADGTTRLVTRGAETTAGTSRLRDYRGRTSQALWMDVTTAKVDSTIHLRDLYVLDTLGCEDGTGREWFIHGHGVTLPPARLDIDRVLPFYAFHVHGRLGTHMGSGTASEAIPTLNTDEQAQLCTTGDLTWRAWRTDAGKRPIVP